MSEPLVHTPGPWEAVPPYATQGWGWCVEADGFVILSVRGPKRPQEQKKADAAQSAASPDLLAACELLLRDVAAGALQQETIEAAARAVKKAKGG